jgi:hypothetical protein
MFECKLNLFKGISELKLDKDFDLELNNSDPSDLSIFISNEDGKKLTMIGVFYFHGMYNGEEQKEKYMLDAASPILGFFGEEALKKFNIESNIPLCEPKTEKEIKDLVSSIIKNQSLMI